MLANYEKFGFKIRAEHLPESCTWCPFDGAEHEGYLRKSGDERYRNDPNLYLPKNYYFLVDDYGICKTCLFRVSHIQNYKILA